jgi:hypothetical protein
MQECCTDLAKDGDDDNTRYDMEGRITTPPTTSGVQKRAGQSKADGISKPNIARPYNCQSCAPAKKSTGKSLHQCLLGKHNRQAHTQKNLDANRQERRIKADFIPALSWDWPIMPGEIMQGRPEGGVSIRNGLLHSRPLPRRRMNQKTTDVSYPAPLSR